MKLVILFPIAFRLTALVHSRELEAILGSHLRNVKSEKVLMAQGHQGLQDTLDHPAEISKPSVDEFGNPILRSLESEENGGLKPAQKRSSTFGFDTEFVVTALISGIVLVILAILLILCHTQSN